MNLEPVEVTIARLEGFLKAFEWMNHKANHGCCFAILRLRPGGTVVESLAERFGPTSSNFKIEEIAVFDRELHAVLNRFLFLFQEEFGDSLVDPRRSFTIMHDWGRSDLLDELISQIRLLGVTKAWRIIPGNDCDELREWCFQDDLVLGYPGGFLLIHLGVSD